MKYNFFLFIFLIAAFSACENSTEEFITETYQDYYPLQVGKSITYRLDSLVFTQNGSQIETHKYQVKHTIQSEFIDNQGRKAYLVNRSIRNEAGTNAWIENGNFTVTPLVDQLEVVENNLRVIKLHNPLKKGFSWRGNAYLSASPYRPAYDMDAGSDMNQWNFVYSNFGDTTVNGQPYKDVWSISQNNYALNIPPPAPNSIGVKEVGHEQYAKGIGMVYRNYEIYERQPPNVDNPQQTYTGFGITMWMIEHN